MATMVLPMGSSSVLSTPPPTPPMENPSIALPHHRPTHRPPPPPKPLRPAKENLEKRGGSSAGEANTTTSCKRVANLNEKTPQPRSQTKPSAEQLMSDDSTQIFESHDSSPLTSRGRQVSRFLSTPEDYFRGVSPLCRRLLEDLTSVREAWGQDWASLTYDQQCKILDQAIVDEVSY